VKTDCLYQNDEACIRSAEFTDALRAVGVRDNDVVFIHADLGVFGRIGPGIDKLTLCRSLLDAIERCIPDGTLAMPTFTYSFCRGKLFDREKSPAEQMGLLSEFFRTEKGVVRSTHPIVSVAARGPKAEKLIDVDLDAYGAKSVFARLHALDAIVVFFGAPFDRATFIHHIEAMHAVPYRSAKIFTGTIRSGGSERKVSCTYHVLPLDGSVQTELSRLETKLRRDGDLREASVGAGRISGVRVRNLFSTGTRMLEENIDAFIQRIPLKKRVPTRE